MEILVECPEAGESRVRQLLALLSDQMKELGLQPQLATTGRADFTARVALVGHGGARDAVRKRVESVDSLRRLLLEATVLAPLARLSYAQSGADPAICRLIVALVQDPPPRSVRELCSPDGLSIRSVRRRWVRHGCGIPLSRTLAGVRVLRALQRRLAKRTAWQRIAFDLGVTRHTLSRQVRDVVGVRPTQCTALHVVECARQFTLTFSALEQRAGHRDQI